MALILGRVVEHGVPPRDRAEAFEQIFSARDRISEAARNFAVESAGLSGLTQMEWVLRSALEAGRISGISFDQRINREILDGIEHGRELFDEYREPEVRQLNREFSPEHLLSVGNVRCEIAAGAEMGAVTISRLPASASRRGRSTLH